MKIHYQAVGFYKAPASYPFIKELPRDTEAEAEKDAEEILAFCAKEDHNCYVQIIKRYDDDTGEYFLKGHSEELCKSIGHRDADTNE